ncbi:hypothetical protein VNO77_02307 [Canavalia gladiata]|uniref:Uncharacterized protein n=1 Tax=Canavalia gladiata TaxID=3824 RepID=A0AAN9MY08_CANGL
MVQLMLTPARCSYPNGTISTNSVPSLPRCSYLACIQTSLVKVQGWSRNRSPREAPEVMIATSQGMDMPHFSIAAPEMHKPCKTVFKGVDNEEKPCKQPCQG